MTGPLRVDNLRYGTSPVVVHAQNMREPDVASHFRSLLAEIAASPPAPLRPADLTVVTATNLRTTGSLVWSLRHAGFSNVHVVGAALKRWDFVCKVPLLRDFLGGVRTRYVMYCDSHDVAVLRPDVALERFAATGLGVLFNGECAYWPDLDDFRKANPGPPPRSVTLREAEADMARSAGATAPTFFNSGCWIADLETARVFLDKCGEQSRVEGGYLYQHGGEYLPNDQPVLRAVFHELGARAGVDWRSEVFQTLVGKRWDNGVRAWRRVVDVRAEVVTCRTSNGTVG